RSGRYVRQHTGYNAFIPAPLPPVPEIKLEGEIQFLLSRADRELGRLDGSIQILPNPDLFVYMYVRKEAVLSSQIEGTQSSLQDVLAAEAKIYNPERPSDTEEVINYISAMNYGLDRLDKLPVSTRLIKEIYQKLLKKGRGHKLIPGEIRKSQNWIGLVGCTLSEATFVPPPPYEISQSLSNLENFLHNNQDLPLLVKIGLIHAQFETIHPFLDGNGRIGRLLITFLLCEQNVLQKPVLYLSLYFKQQRQNYYDLLQSVREHGKWEEWLIFFLKGIIAVSAQASDTIRRIQLLRENHRELIMDTLGKSSGNGQRVLDYLFNHPLISVSDVQKLSGTSYPAANELVSKLVKMNILSEYTGQIRNRKFIYMAYIRIIENMDIVDSTI
ncbi:MAG: Fic family protein, partial [Candidatus Marinimicrobia bacterium]|nr:Fic family protein [Candidatus Neomarinimicrobiota bacterium]